MVRRRANPHAEKKRRLPFTVVIDREDPFLDADRKEIEAECRRITNGADEFYLTMERRERRYVHVAHFKSQHQADAFHTIARARDYVKRPVPQFGPPEHEKRAFRDAALLWGFRTGAIRRVLRAYRDTPGSLMRQDAAARDVLHAYRMPEGHGDILRVFLEWVWENHLHWFERQRHPGYLPFDHLHWVIPQDAYPHSDE